ncbi:MAG: L-aspartate oxidase [Pseudomonadota bacterium]
MESAPAHGGIIIVGAGIAGLWTALKLAPHPVTVVTAGRLGDGSSSWAQGGLAAAIGQDDNARLHAEDTIQAGAGLAQPEAVDVLCAEGPESIEQLASLGVPFDREADGTFRLGREAAHKRDRIVHVGGDEAGAAIMRTLAEHARRANQIVIRERTVCERLMTENDQIIGIQCWDVASQKLVMLRTNRVVMATGGLGGLFQVTTNPLYAQGHGLSLAADAGAILRDLEFVQFHPTGLDVGRDPAPLATEAIRGEGGHLVDADGQRFMLALHEDAELAPRDVVARGVAKAIAETGRAFLDVRGSLGQRFARAFPTVNEACRQADLDPEKDLIPIAPAAHYHMGGIKTDLDGAASVEGLFAVGECASTGVHGANRLASNSLLEAIVFGRRAAEKLLGSEDRALAPLKLTQDETLHHAPASHLHAIRQAMAKEAGLLRTAQGLSDLQERLVAHEPQSVGERLAVQAAGALITAALAREESRGAHQRADHPDQTAPQHSEVRRDQTGWSVTFKTFAP